MKAVNLGDDADTVGAITGQIVGAYYGLDNIPDECVTRLAKKDLLFDLIDIRKNLSSRQKYLRRNRSSSLL